jgi:AraC family transcriptional regulator of adaptative response/methylated-DNA-[protein]-cysteine methyltransferase
MKLTRTQMVKAMRTNNASYDGRFYVCVTSTMIYCLPSCKAKTPLVKNVRFVESREDAVRDGFRGCKRCRAAEFPNVLPSWFDPLMQSMSERVGDRLDESELARIAGVDISTLRRYFKTRFQMTPITYHRKLRLAHARKLIAQGADYLTAAYESGYESSSGFRDAFVKEFCVPPGRCYDK